MKKIHGIVVAIDGPAGCGKSTAAGMLAEVEGFAHLNTGALYRAVTFLADEGGVDPEKYPGKVAQIARKMIFTYEYQAGNLRYRVAPAQGKPERDLTPVLFTASLTSKLKPVVNNEAVREELVKKMREAAHQILAQGVPGVILEGRDIGTVVFPDAFIKFYLQADLEERTRRRAQELRLRGEVFAEDGLRKQIEYRDKVDESRTVGPLKKAPDAILIDTTLLDKEGVLKKLQEEMRRAHGKENQIG
jgi:cytidylate kinase